MNLANILLGLACLAAGLNWWAVWQDNATLRYITKPAVIVFLMAWLWVYAQPYDLPLDGIRLKWFLWGLGFALLGDIFLMLPKARFGAGLSSFLLMQISYSLGLFKFPWDEYMTVPGIALAIVCIPIFGLISLELVKGVRHNQPKLLFPVLIYMVALSAMVYLAIFNAFINRNFQVLPAYLVAFGGLAILFSDVILGWNKFVRPIPEARLKVNIPYHLGQLMMVVGAAIHFTQF